MAARRPATQFAHVVERLYDAFNARLAILIKQFAFAGQRRAARGAQKKPCIELRFELLHVAADGGAANAEVVTRLGEATFVGHCEKRNDTGVTCGEAARER